MTRLMSTKSPKSRPRSLKVSLMSGGGNVEVELDDEGCVFEDHKQECFRKLVNVIRLRAIVRKPGFCGWVRTRKPAPMPAHLVPVMATMLENLMIDSKEFFNTLDSQEYTTQLQMGALLKSLRS
ncbi:hypothetical protein JKP88DRAFT_255307 [Tribonema minus]|uniref:Uncharacterized protein n=1 Tax=Tribonema minus TaxID=303371 RepID=A0A836CG89_9STRA|nr:hypothetical protein JKP88DRAFT_255307 [Tribonema minus]